MDQNSGVHGNRKPPFTYNGENGVHSFSVAFDLILFILASNKDMHKISDEFEFRPDRTTDYRDNKILSALERLKISHRLIMGKWCFHASSFIFDRIIIKIAVSRTGIWARSSSILGRIRPLILELLALE